MMDAMAVIQERPDLDRQQEIKISAGTIAILNQGDMNEALAAWLYQVARRWPYLPTPIRPQGNQIARQRNMAVERMVGTWLLFVDSDCVPPSPDVVMALVQCEAPIVSGVVLERWPPFRVAATHRDTGEKLELRNLPADGPLDVATTGAACLLVRREVFAAMEPPWFRCGQVDPQYVTEDTEFCLRAARAGFRAILHCGVRVGHRATGILWPGRDGKKWVEWRGPVDARETLDETGGEG